MYNNAPSTTTGILLFFANQNYYLSITIYLERDIVLSHTHEFTVDLDELQDTLKTEMFTIQQCHQ